ncbi:gliding motility-associated C-terminal domain-containing protein [Flavobacterium sp. LB2R40]|uniref:T9SS type B sorting domain-containing protein n=1 Tax=Flavobacterium sp. LB2R40 TaxID=3401722 RepID=UPI003AB07AA2
MKKILLLFLLFHLLLGYSLNAKNLEDNLSFNNLNFELISSDTIKKKEKKTRVARSSRILAILPSPITTAGSSCGNGINPVQINVYAFGVNGNETIEWFVSQSSVIPIFTGSIYSPSISTTRTYYVQSRFGNDISTRIPVVASVYIVPPAVSLTASPANNPSAPLCLGTSVTFTATGGGDLFEFSVDGVVKQAMSTNKMFVTNTLTDGQVVRVRTRFAVVFDGNITEKAWGTGPLEDNFLSAPLSLNSTTGYINSLKISSTEDKLVFGIAGKSLSNRRILLFLDTKVGGFNVSNYGDETGPMPLVNGFNFFNNSLNTFDSYFQADYCLVIGTDAGETNYISDIIELKTGTSIKTNLGNASTGTASSVMGVNKNNTGINDYNLGFEVEILKSLLGYTTGDIKFFAMTVADQDETNFVVANSFLSPERTSSLDYGNGAVDYNLKDPNPVIVSSAALTPCYSEVNVMMNFVSIPTTSSVVQPTCAVPSGSISISTQSGVEYSLNGIAYQASNVFSGLTPNSYTIFVRNISDTGCVTSSSSSIIINAVPTPPVAPTTASVAQPTCAVPSGSISIATQSGVEYSINGTIYQASNTFSGLTANSYTLYVRNLADATCVTASNTSVIINTTPNPPLVPTTSSVVQPTCAVPLGTISITTQSGVEYSINGTTYQVSNTFSGLTANSYTLYVRNLADTTCVTPSNISVVINAAPNPPLVPTASSVVQPTCAVPSGTISITTQTGVEYSVNGATYQTSNIFPGLIPNSYTVYVRKTADATCVTPSATPITINAVPTPPVIPTTSSVVQPTCAIPSGSISITTQSGVEYSLNGTTYQSSNIFSGLAPNNYTLYVRNTTDTTCLTTSSSTISINLIPAPPIVPTTASLVQPTCAVPSGSISIRTQSGVEYSLNGTTYQVSNTFSGLTPNNYTLYVRNITDGTCTAQSASVITINAIQILLTPTVASVVQPTCASPTGAIVITTQPGVEYSLDGIAFQVSNTFTGLPPNSYTLYIRSTIDATCLKSSVSMVTINVIPTSPTVPITTSIVQPTCAVPSGTIVIASQLGVEYSLNGTAFQTSNSFTGLGPNTYTLYVRNIADPTCSVQSSIKVIIDPLPALPMTPSLLKIIQPTCLIPSGSIEITGQTNVQYSVGNTYQDSAVFTNLAPGRYTISVRFTNSVACIAVGSVLTINAIPPQIQFETVGDCENKEYTLTATPISGTYDPNNVSYQWKDKFGNPVGTNSNVLNVTNVIASTPGGQVVFPVAYTLTVTSVNTGCETSGNIVVESIYCNMQKGISPDGNGSNDFFDLRSMSVKKLEVFNRYGIKVYSQSNYTDQWNGQSNKGEELPSATYYYVIEFNSGESTTGWIYLIREKQ